MTVPALFSAVLARRRYDEFGSIKSRSVWDNVTVHKFSKNEACFVKQYSSFVGGHTLDGADEHVNGKLTVNENLADNGGVALAFLAHQRYAREHRLRHGGADAPRVVPSLSNDQLFFVAFAQNWCAKTEPPMAETALHTDVHSPPEVRSLLTSAPCGSWSATAVPCDCKQADSPAVLVATHVRAPTPLLLSCHLIGGHA